MKASYLLTLALTVFALPCVAQQVEFMGRLISAPAPLLQAEAAPEKPGLVKIYPDEDEKSFLQALERPVDVLSTPTVTTRLKQRATIQVAQEFKFLPNILGDKSLLKPNWKPNLAAKKVDLGFTLECEAMSVSGDQLGINCRPTMRTLLGFRERAVPSEALKETYTLQTAAAGPAKPLLRTADFQVLEADVNLNLRSGSLALIYLGRDDQEDGNPRYLYVLLKSALAPKQISSL